MNDVMDTVDGWVDDGSRVALATVVDTKKSAPQPPGTKMAINDAGKLMGAVSGGCVEGQVVQVAGDPGRRRPAAAALQDRRRGRLDVGLPVRRRDLDHGWRTTRHGLQGRFAELARQGGGGARTVLEGPEGVGEAPGDRDEARSARLQRARAARRWRIEAMVRAASCTARRQDPFVDAVARRPPDHLRAVDFAAQLAAAARMAGWRSFVVDPRKRFATADRFPEAERVIAEWPDKALDQLGGIDRATSIAVLTHDPKLDDAVLRIALRSEAQYIGAMGSRRAQEKRRERLLAQGLTDQELGRLAAPIGLDIGALTAAETAISIMGEITAVRRGREGGRLMAVKGRIHDAAADEAREAAAAR
jgi:xanthine dehydrogenase accessory factor